LDLDRVGARGGCRFQQIQRALKASVVISRQLADYERRMPGPYPPAVDLDKSAH
jgi:hypothetical protein